MWQILKLVGNETKTEKNYRNHCAERCKIIELYNITTAGNKEKMGKA